MIGNNRCEIVKIGLTEIVCDPRLEGSSTQGMLPVKVGIDMFYILV